MTVVAAAEEAPARATFCKAFNPIAVAVFIALYCDYVLNSMGVPILPSYLAKLNVDQFWVGALFAAKPAIQIVANLGTGVMVDKLGAKKVLLWGLGILAISTAVFGVGLTMNLGPTATYTCLMTARLVQGLSSAAIMSSGMTWVAQTHAPSRRGSVMGVVLVGIGAGAVSGATLGGVLASFLGNASPFFFVTLLLFFDSLLTLGQPDSVAHEEDVETQGANEPKPKPKGECSQLAHLLRDPTIICINVLVFAGNAGMTVLQPTLPLHVEKTLGYGSFGQGLIWGWMTFTYLLCRPLSGYLSDRFPKWLITGCGTTTLGLGLTLVGMHLSMAGLCVGICLVGTGVAFITTPCMPLLADVVEMNGEAGYGLVYSMADISTSMGMIVGPMAGAILNERYGFKFVCQVFALGCMAATGCSWYLKKISKNRRDK